MVSGAPDYWLRGKVGEVTTIRDVQWSSSPLILNPSFEQGFTGWWNYLGIGTIADGYLIGNCCRFPVTTLAYAQIAQKFPIAWTKDWLTDLFLLLRSSVAGVNALAVSYRYTDLSFTSEAFQVTAAGTWEKKTLSPTAGKYVMALWINTMNPSANVDIDDITMVK